VARLAGCAPAVHIDYIWPGSPNVCYSASHRTMQRWITVFLGALVIVVLGVLAWRGGSGGHSHSGLGSTAADTSGVLPNPPTLTTTHDASIPSLDTATSRPEHDGGAGEDSSGITALPTGTPKAVRFGVVVVRYRGADGTPPTERSKQDAFVLARGLAEAAKTDFRGAVSRGDAGSMEDAGRMPRGVLDSSTEYTLFTLKPGEVSDPIDTPRGFWILRRID
jgi:hypothetical protein